MRHTSVAVPRGTCYGHSDVALADTFAAEAQEVKSRIEGLVAGQVSSVYSSPLSRCWQLAAFCGYRTPIEDARLLELNFGAWELKAWDDIQDPRLPQWYDDYIYTAPTRGESFAEQCQRVASFLDEVWGQVALSRGDTIVFSHGGVLRAAMVWAGHYALERAFDYDCPYGTVEIIQRV